MMKSAPENRAAGTTVLIVASFHRYIAAGAGKPERRENFPAGKTVEASDADAAAWMAAGVAKTV